MPFLPISKQDMKDRGIDQLDFICVTGDAYVDHPSFGIAIISRMLESCGCNVGIIAQPVTDEDFKKLGEPKYCFLVTGGNIDSMVSNYTVFKKKRWDDAYSEGGKGGKRPDRAVTVYCKTLTRLFPDKEIAIGGLEASLRRFAHYDYWADKVMPSILVDSGAKLLMYGMGELTIVQLYRELAEGKKLSEIHDIRGTCYLTEPKNTPLGAVQCDSFEIVSENKKAYAKSCRQQYDEQDEVYGKTMVQRHGNMMLVQNPPQRSLTQSEFDKAYELPYMKAYHPCYEKGGGVPGIKEVEFSITHNRGCFGYCNFCSIALHQGRRIQTRSEESVINEAIDLTKKPGFKGYIHDVGGPTANFRRTSCDKQEKAGLCKGKKCLAPEHASNKVLDLMGKPHIEVYEDFEKKFYKYTKECGKEQYLVPYLMSSHPGCTIKEAVELAVFLKKHNIRPEQVQDFYPTPGTISTAMYYTGLDPYTMQEVYIPRDPKEKEMQRALLQYYKKENKQIVAKALIRAGRRDLIGYGKECLITPDGLALQQDRKGAVKNGKNSSSKAKTYQRQGNKSGGRSKMQKKKH